MKEDDILRDDFLKELVQKSPLDSPSDDFVSRVMGNIQLGPEPVRVRQPFFLMVRSAWPYVLGSVILLIFLFTSDLPFTDYIPGKGFYTNFILPSFNLYISWIRDLFSHSKYTPIGLIIIGAGGFLFLFDRLLDKKPHSQHHNVLL